MSDRNYLKFGSGYEGRFFTCEELGDEPIGMIVEGPAAPQCPFQQTGAARLGRCAGGIHFENAPEQYIRKQDGTTRPTWKVESLEPLTVAPSIECGCKGQHGFVQGGRYVSAGGVEDP